MQEEAASNPEERDEPLDAKSLRERLGAFKEETSRQLFDEFKADLRAAQRVAEVRNAVVTDSQGFVRCHILHVYHGAKLTHLPGGRGLDERD